MLMPQPPRKRPSRRAREPAGKRQDVLPFNLSSLLGLLTRRPHLVDPGGLRRLLERHLPCARLEDAAIPIHMSHLSAYWKPMRFSSE